MRARRGRLAGALALCAAIVATVSACSGGATADSTPAPDLPSAHTPDRGTARLAAEPRQPKQAGRAKQATAAKQAAPAKQARPAKRSDGGPVASRAAALQIHKWLIPYGAERKRDMARYSKRHYGRFRWRLRDPKLIVEHFAVAGSVSAIHNTFAPNRPDVEFGELPGVCSHFAVSAKGLAYKFVPTSIRCRHVVGLNQVAIGIEHVGFSDAEILGRKRQLRGSLRLTQQLRCRFEIPVKNVIGHNESLSSPFYKERDPDFRGQTHGDWRRASMQIYRAKLRRLGPC